MPVSSRPGQTSAPNHSDVPAAVIVLGAGSIGTPAGMLKLGHFAAMRTDGEGAELLTEVFVGGEGLACGPADVLGTLLHEAVHAIMHGRSGAHADTGASLDAVRKASIDRLRCARRASAGDNHLVGPHRRWVADFWDEVVQSWLDGQNPMPDPLSEWYGGYQGRGLGKATRDGFPEPYLTDLRGVVHEPRVVLLGLNPGRYLPDLQARNRAFADEIRGAGSYSAWVLTCPYVRDPWQSRYGVNIYQSARLNFTRRWLDDPAATHLDFAIFELYPWHSARVTAPIRPAPGIIDRFVWQPIAEIGVDEVWAFGRPWQAVAERLGLSQVRHLGRAGEPFSAVNSRTVLVYRLPSGQRLIVSWQSGYAGPPGRADVDTLRTLLDR